MNEKNKNLEGNHRHNQASADALINELRAAHSPKTNVGAPSSEETANRLAQFVADVDKKKNGPAASTVPATEGVLSTPRENLEEQLPERNWEGESHYGVEVTKPTYTPMTAKERLAWLTKVSSKERTKTGLKSKEAEEKHTEFRDLRSNIRNIRKSLNHIEKNKNVDANKEEIQKLRDELAHNLVAFRNISRPKEKKTEAGATPHEDLLTDLSPEEIADKQSWEAMAAATQKNEKSDTVTSVDDQLPPLDSAAIEAVKEWETFSESMKGTKKKDEQVKPPLSEATTQEEILGRLDVLTGKLNELGTKPMPEEPESGFKPEFLERSKVRAEWRKKKQTYEDAYGAYLADVEKRKSERSFIGKFFVKKEEQPQELLTLEKDYQDARRTYAEVLDGALSKRRVGNISLVQPKDPDQHWNYTPEKRIEMLRAGLANRFVIGAAQDRLRIEKEHTFKFREGSEFNEGGEKLQVFNDLVKALGRHRRLVTLGGYALVGGMGLATGGVGAAAFMLAQKYALAPVMGAVIGAGATGGGLLANLVSDHMIGTRADKRDLSIKTARKRFSFDDIEKLETDYYDNYKSHERAVRNKKYVVGAGAIAGGALAALAASGSLDDAVSLPEEEIFEEEDGERESEAETAPRLDKNVESFPNGDEFMNPSGVEEDSDISPNRETPDVSEYEELGSYTIQPGDNPWDIMEGQTDAPQLPTLSEIAPEDLQATIDLTRDYLNEHPLVAQDIGFKVDGDIGQIYPGDELDLDMFEAVTRDIAVENGFLAPEITE